MHGPKYALKGLPKTISKAREIAAKIRQAKQDQKDNDVIIKILPYSNTQWKSPPIALRVHSEDSPTPIILT